MTGPDHDPATLVVRTTIEPSAGRGPVRRTGVLTPYFLQLVQEDVLHAGQNATLDVCVPQRTTDAPLRVVARLFAPLARRGARVRVSRDYGWRPASLKLHGRERKSRDIVRQTSS